MDVVGEAGDGDEAVALVEQLQPAVVLMDLRMPKADGIQATARIRERWPEIPVLVLTTFDDDANLFGALRAGAAGYLLKDVSSETLVSAIQAATRGESFLQSTVTGRVVAAFARLMESGGPKAEALVLPLSPREREILVLLGTRRLEQGDRRSAQPRRRHGQEPRDEHPHQARRPGSHAGGHPRPAAGPRLKYRSRRMSATASSVGRICHLRYPEPQPPRRLVHGVKMPSVRTGGPYALATGFRLGVCAFVLAGVFIRSVHAQVPVALAGPDSPTADYGYLSLAIPTDPAGTTWELRYDVCNRRSGRMSFAWDDVGFGTGSH